MSRFSFSLTLVLVLSGCGIVGGGGKVFKEGYYKADGELKDRHYPLVAIKYESAEGRERLGSYAVNHVSGSWGAGVSTTDLSSASIDTSVFLSATEEYRGTITQEKESLKVVSKKATLNDPNHYEAGSGKAVALQEYTLAKIEKQEAIRVFRSLVKRSGSGTEFSDDEEKKCQGMFQTPCNELYEASN